MLLKRLTLQLRNASGAKPQGRPRVTAGAVTLDLRLHKAAGMAAGKGAVFASSGWVTVGADRVGRGGGDMSLHGRGRRRWLRLSAWSSGLSPQGRLRAAAGAVTSLSSAQVHPLAAALGRVVTAGAVTLIRGGGEAPETCLR